MFPILPIPPIASSLPLGENARERMPPMLCRLARGSHVYITGVSISATFSSVSVFHTAVCPMRSPVASHLPSDEVVTAYNIEGK